MKPLKLGIFLTYIERRPLMEQAAGLLFGRAILPAGREGRPDAQAKTLRRV